MDDLTQKAREFLDANPKLGFAECLAEFTRYILALEVERLEMLILKCRAVNKVLMLQELIADLKSRYNLELKKVDNE